jgi:hypothetical protein
MPPVTARARERRINQGVFVSGMTGSGKSRMAEKLAQPWKRVVFVDPTRSFEAIDFRATTFAEAIEFLKSRWLKKPFRLAVTFDDEDDYPRFFQAFAKVAVGTFGQCDNVLLVLDEVDMWTSPRKVERSVSFLLRYGRHYGICWIAICRADVQTHRDVRMNATQIIVFRQGMLSGELKTMIQDAGLVREERLTMPARLQKWNTKADAVEGENFIALPERFDEWLPSWQALARMRERE